MQLLAKTFYGLEDVLAKELIDLGANDVEIQNRAVSFSGDLRFLYKANLSLRTASRILMPLSTFTAHDAEEVYNGTKKIDWSEWMGVHTTFSVSSTVHSENFTNSQIVAYKVKDAIVDQFREKDNTRPNVCLVNPDLYINVHVSHNTCTVSLDSSGESLHKRGYRTSQNEAPISEALAAGMLLKAGWDGTQNFIDPMCGSGTFLIEAALIALNIPPCLYRKKFAFEAWMNFDKEILTDLYQDDTMEKEFTFKIYGSDRNKRALQIAEENIKSAGVAKYIELTHTAVVDLQKPEGPCLMVTNPPYGERMVPEDLYEIYSDLGTTLKHQFAGSNAWVISSDTECLWKVGMKPSTKTKIINGKLDCEYWQFEIFDGKRSDFVRERKESGQWKEKDSSYSGDKRSRYNGERENQYIGKRYESKAVAEEVETDEDQPTIQRSDNALSLENVENRGILSSLENAEKTEDNPRPYSRESKPFERDRDRRPYDRKPYDRDRKPYNSDRKPFDRDRKPYDRDRKPFDRDRKSYDRDRKPYNSDRKPFDRDRKPYNSDRKPFDRDRKPYDGERKPYNSDRKPFDRDRKPYDRERKPYNSDRKPFDRDRKPYDRDRKPYNSDRKPFDRDRKPYDRERKPYNANPKRFDRDRKPFGHDSRQSHSDED